MMRGIGVVALFAGIASVIRLVQDAAIAWRFGTGPLVDAYYFVVSFTNWPLGLALSVLTVLVVPVDADLRNGDAVMARRFRAELLGHIGLAAVISLPLAWFALDRIAGGSAAGLPARTGAHAHSGVPGIVGMVPLGIVGALLSAWFVAAGRHVVTLLEALPPLVLALLVLLLPGASLFWGTTAGVAVQVIVMAALLRLAGELPRPRLTMSAAAWQRFAQGAIVLLVAQALFTLVPLVDMFFAARLGEGMAASLGFASRLIVGLQALAALALRRAGLPLLSHLSARTRVAARRTAFRWSWVAAASGMVVGLAVALLADPIVSFLFERGSFTASDRDQVATLLRYGMLQMPPFFVAILLMTALASEHARVALAVVAALGLLMKLLANALLVPLFGLTGLMLASAFMHCTAAVVAWLALRHRRNASGGSRGRPS